MPFDTPAQHFFFSTVRIEASGPSGILASGIGID